MHIDVRELTFTNDTRIGARTLCGLDVWPDQAITLTALKYTPPVDEVCPACKAAVVDTALEEKPIRLVGKNLDFGMIRHYAVAERDLAKELGLDG